MYRGEMVIHRRNLFSMGRPESASSTAFKGFVATKVLTFREYNKYLRHSFFHSVLLHFIQWPQFNNLLQTVDFPRMCPPMSAYFCITIMLAGMNEMGQTIQRNLMCFLRQHWALDWDKLGDRYADPKIHYAKTYLGIIVDLTSR